MQRLVDISSISKQKWEMLILIMVNGDYGKMQRWQEKDIPRSRGFSGATFNFGVNALAEG